MSTRQTIKQISINNLADQLMQLRGEMSQERMAEKCSLSLRNYSNLERRQTSATSMTMLNLYAVGVDLNRWAQETLEAYRKLYPDGDE